MTWVRLDDQFDEHDKWMDAGHEAGWMMVRALAYCNRKETDGHIKSQALDRIGSDFGPTKRKKLAARLVEVGMLHTPGHDCPRCPQPIEGWQVHDYTDYQPSRAKLEADREQRRQAGRNGGRKRAANAKAKRAASGSLSESLDDPQANRQAEAQAKSKPGPVPVPPATDVAGKPPSPSARSPRGSRLPDDWRPADEPELIAAVGGIDAARAEYRKFRDYWVAQPGAKGRKVDWQATWRNWLRRAAEDRPGSNGRPKGPPRPPEGDVDYRAGWHGREATS